MLNHLLGIRDELCPMVLGGEGLMWGETADASNALQVCVCVFSPDILLKCRFAQIPNFEWGFLALSASSVSAPRSKAAYEPK